MPTTLRPVTLSELLKRKLKETEEKKEQEADEETKKKKEELTQLVMEKGIYAGTAKFLKKHPEELDALVEEAKKRGREEGLNEEELQRLEAIIRASVEFAEELEGETTYFITKKKSKAH